MEAASYPDQNNSVFRAQYELVTLHASVTKCLTKRPRKGGINFGSHFEGSSHHSKKDRPARVEYMAEGASINWSHCICIKEVEGNQC